MTTASQPMIIEAMFDDQISEITIAAMISDKDIQRSLISSCDQ
jgi:hypothetical protein